MAIIDFLLAKERDKKLQNVIFFFFCIIWWFSFSRFNFTERISPMLLNLNLTQKAFRFTLFAVVFCATIGILNAHESHEHDTDSHHEHHEHSHDLEGDSGDSNDSNLDSAHSHSHSQHKNHSHITSRYQYLHDYAPHTHSNGRISDFASLSARVGIFGKSSALASKDMSANHDNYVNLYSTILLHSTPFAHSNNALDGLVAGAGVVAYAPFYNDKANSHTYISSNFVANNAYLGYIKDFSPLGVEILAGRFDRSVEWVWHSMQGIFARLSIPLGANNLHSVQIYGIWVDEQAHIMREMSTDFNFYKQLYNKENLYVGGINLSFALAQNARLHFEPYVYYLNNYFGVYGSKIVLDIGFGGGNNSGGTQWRSKTLAHSAFLYSNYARIHAGDNMMEHNMMSGSHSSHSINTSNRGDTYFVLIEQEFDYKDFVYFGAGFQRIGGNVFEIANLGNNSRFEAHDGGGFGVIRPGAIHSGSNITNAFDALTNTYYGFVGAQFGQKNQFALEAMGRDSRSATKAQSAFSLGLKYAFDYGFEIGGIGVFMLDEHQHGQKQMKLNRSFGKAYIQWSF